MYFNTNFISPAAASQPLRSQLQGRGWLRRLRQTAPRLIMVLILVLLGHFGGRTSYHVVEGMIAPSYIADGDDLPALFSNPPASSPTLPTPPLPQSHILHHVHCQLAPSLSVIDLSPLLVVLMFWPSRRLILPQTDLTPTTPPPIRTLLIPCRLAH